MPGQSLLFGAPRRRRALAAVVAALAVVGTLGAPAWADGGQGSGQSSTAQQGSSTQQGSSAGGTNQQNQGSDAAAGPSDRQARADEQQFLQLANQTRAQQGAQPLVADGGLAAIARWWAGNMASADDIFHNMKLPDDVTAAVTPDWEKLGENVGKGQDVPQLHRAFVNSPHHYENLIDQGYAQVGIGVVLGSDGTIYVVFDFMQVFPPAPPQPAATPLPAPARTVVMDHIVSRHDGPSTTQPAPPPTTEPVVAPPPAPRPPPAAATQVPPPPPALNALIGQLRATDGPLRHRGGRPGSAKIVRTAGTWTQRSAPAPRRFPAASDTAAASRLWLPASYCEGPNKARSRMC